VARNLPLRNSLLLRLLTTSILVAIGSIVATAWLATQTVTQAIHREQGQALSKDARVYDALVGYAATHPDWDDVGATVSGLARRNGLRVSLVTPDHQPIADSDPAAGSLGPTASAVVDPLQVDPALVRTIGADRIDPRALGPFRLSSSASAQRKRAAEQFIKCVKNIGAPGAGHLTRAANGRWDVVFDHSDPGTDKARFLCTTEPLISVPLPKVTATEKRALGRLNQLIAACLYDRGVAPVAVDAGFTPIGPASGDRAKAKTVQTCVGSARREQLAAFVAPPALLSFDNPGSVGGSGNRRFDLSRANATRIIAVTAGVLALTVLITVMVGTRLVRPLRLLTEAVRRPNGEQIRIPVTSSNEIGYLAETFNEMSDRRQKAETQRKDLVSDIAHELRTPLNNIRGWLEAAEDGVTEIDRELTSSLLEEALLLQHVVDDLQDLAEAEAGELTLHPEPLPVGELLAQVASAQRGKAEAAGVLLSSSAGGELWVEADPIRLRQAVGNLVSNAIRHSPPGGVVTLRAHRTPDEVVIDVVDHGPGISPEHLPHVFDRFWRAEKSRSRQTGGSGLGLAIVRQLARAHGGEATVSSDPGVETVFAVHLPVSAADPAAGQLRTRHPAAGT
jgi:two-component system sensor histidine kinase BaeS